MERQKISIFLFKGLIISLIFCFPFVLNAKPIDIGKAGDSINILGTNLCLDASCISSWNDIGGSWITNGTSIYYNTGRVGIGTANPTGALDIASTESFRTNGPVLFSGSLYAGSGDRLLMVDNTGNVIAATMTDAVGLPASSLAGQTLRSTGAGWEASSVLFNNGANVGIGTTNPFQAKLVVNGNIAIPRSGGLIFLESISGGERASIKSSDVAPYNELIFSTGGASESMRIVNGDVGIGTTGPTYKLQVNDSSAAQAVFTGWSSFGSSSGHGALLIGGVMANQARIQYDGQTGIIYLDNSFNHSNGDIRFRTRTHGTAVNVMTLEANGNVGIGTTTPIQKLHVSGQGNFEGITEGYSPSTNQTFAFTTVEYVDGMIDGSYVDTVGFWTQSGTDISNSNTGNVGIGTTAPGAKLSVAGRGFFGEDTTSPLLTLYGGATTNDAYMSYGRNSGGYVWTTGMFDDQTSDYQIKSHGGVSRLLIDYNGNVGIGTASPNTLAHIRGASPILRVEASSGSQEAQLHLDAHDNTGSAGIYFTRVEVSDSDYGKIGWTGGTSGDLFTEIEGNRVMTWKNSGNVGIGTTEPSQKLQVAGTVLGGNPFVAAHFSNMAAYSSGSGGAPARITLGRNNTLHGYIEAGSNSDTNSANGYLAFGNRQNVNEINEVMRFNTVGNVGIGTTGPSQKLHVAGQGVFAGIAEGYSPATNQTYAFTTVEYVDGMIAGSYVDTVGFWTQNGDDISNANIGNIGIGTSNPGSLLTIANNNWISGRNSADTGIVNMFKLNTNNQIEVGAPLLIGPLEFAADSGMISFTDIPVTSASAIGNPQGYVMKIDGNNLLALYAESNGLGGIQNSRVGIGTAAPSTKLELYGADQTLKVTQNPGVAGNSSIWLTSTGANNHAGLNLNGFHIYKQSSTGHLYFGADTTIANSKVTMQSGGNVGIGTTNPTKKLHVAGEGLFNGIVEGSSPATNQTYAFTTVEYVDSMIDGSYVDTVGFWTQNGNDIHNANSGNVGIGTASPQAGMKIDVRSDSGDGNSAITAYGYNGNGGVAIKGYGYATTGTGINYGIYGLSSGSRATGTNIGGYFTASGALNNYALITGSGNVGIGTNAPTGRLTVVGSAGVTRSVAIDNREIKFRGDGVAHFSIFGPDEGKSYLTIQNTGSNSSVGTTGSDLFTILSGGNVGIGTTNPTEKLHVAGEGLFNGIVEGSSPSTNQTFAFTTVEYVDGMITGLYVDTVGFWTQNGANISNSNTGNVGIGTAAPRARLEVLSGTNNTEGDVSRQFNVVGPNYTDNSANVSIQTNNALGAGLAGSIAFGGRYSGTNFANFGKIKAGKENAVSGEYGGYLGFFTRVHGGSLVEQLRIQPNGNVGIGTTNPLSKLHIENGHIIVESDTGAHGGALYLGNSGHGLFRGGTTATGAESSGNDVYLKTTSGDLHMQINSTNILNVTSGGNVGVGTTAPQGIFEIDVGTRNGLDDNGNGLVDEAGESAPGIFVSNIGNLGIGTTNPTKKLHVAGEGLFNGIVEGYTPATNQTFAFTTVEYVDARIGNPVDSGLINQTLRNDGTSWVADSFLYNTGTYLGLGTTNPESLLTIANNNWISSRNSADNGIVNMFKLNTNNQIEVGAPLLIGPLQFAADSGMISFIDMPVTSASAVGTPQGYAMQVDGDSILSVYSESNGLGGIQNYRVGIGTITPSEMLHLDGTSPVIRIDESGSGDPRILFEVQGGFKGLIGIDNSISGDPMRIIAGSETIFDESGITLKNDGNVGIGTTNPTEELHVAGQGLFNGIVEGSSPATNQTYAFTTVEYVDSMIDGSYVDTVGFWTQSGTDISNSNTGNVGIGTTNPSGPLHVFGTASSVIETDDNDDTVLTIRRSEATTRQITFMPAGYSDIGSGSSEIYQKITLSGGTAGIIDAAGSSRLLFNTNGNTKMTILNSGNVGIGTTGPGAKLEIKDGNFRLSRSESDVNYYFDLDLNYNSADSLNFNWAGTPFLQFDNSGQKVTLGYGTGNVVIPNGNVGIGTTNPTEKLHVAGQGNFEGIVEGYTPATNQTFAFTTVEYVDSVMGGLWTQSGNDISNSNTGNVGIGTATPEAKLTVNDGQIYNYGFNVNPSLSFYRAESDGVSPPINNRMIGQIGFYSNTQKVAWVQALASALHSDTSRPTRLVFATTPENEIFGLERMRIDANGNIGIGTTAPSTKLDIQTGSGINTQLKLGKTTGEGFNFGRIDATGFLSIQGTQVGYNSILLAPTSGNVGIGTTAPGGLLDVAGAPQIFLGGTSATLRLTTTAKTLWLQGLDSARTGTVNNVAFSGYGGLNRTMDIDLLNQRVGIGTSAPSEKLHVVGNALVTGETIGTLQGGYGQFRAVAGSYGMFIRNDGANSYFLLTDSGDRYGSWNTLRPMRMENATGNISFGSNALYVEHNDSVGIGTTAPTQKLHVIGQGLFSGIVEGQSPSTNQTFAFTTVEYINSMIVGSSGMIYSRRAIADINDDAEATDYIIAYTSLTTDRTLTLPNSLCTSGRAYLITNETGSSHSVIVDPESTTTISGMANISLEAYNSIPVYCDGSNWFIY